MADNKHLTPSQHIGGKYNILMSSLSFSCTLKKHFYFAANADKEYRHLLSQVRTGITLSEKEIRYLDEFASPLTKQQQSPHYICVTNKDSIMVSEHTVYRLLDAGILSARSIDLSRKVRFTVHVNRQFI